MLLSVYELFSRCDKKKAVDMAVTEIIYNAAKSDVYMHDQKDRISIELNLIMLSLSAKPSCFTDDVLTIRNERSIFCPLYIAKGNEYAEAPHSLKQLSAYMTDIPIRINEHYEVTRESIYDKDTENMAAATILYYCYLGISH